MGFVRHDKLVPLISFLSWLTSIKLAYTGAISSLFVHFHYCGYLVSQWDIRLKTFLIALQVRHVLRTGLADLDKPSLTVLSSRTCSLSSFVVPYLPCWAELPFSFNGVSLRILLTNLRQLTRQKPANIFNPNGFHNSFFWANRIILVVSILLSSATILSEILSCLPVNAHWQPWVKARCFNKKPLEFTVTYGCVIIDFVILLLPQSTIWKLNMNRIKKAGVSAIFSVGILCVLPLRNCLGTRMPQRQDNQRTFVSNNCRLSEFACVRLAEPISFTISSTTPRKMSTMSSEINTS